ncbi:MAG: hypothetical protein ACI9KE_005066 [Polyangiales bacterium]|jgi:hypothetical protein
MSTQASHTTQFWLGYFESEETRSGFFEERFGQDDDDAPVSRFVGSQQQRWLDHDFTEIHHSDSLAAALESLHNYAKDPSWIDAVNATFSSHSKSGCFALVLSSYDSKSRGISCPQSVQEEGVQLLFLGEAPSPF